MYIYSHMEIHWRAIIMKFTIIDNNIERWVRERNGDVSFDYMIPYRTRFTDDEGNTTTDNMSYALILNGKIKGVPKEYADDFKNAVEEEINKQIYLFESTDDYDEDEDTRGDAEIEDEEENLIEEEENRTDAGGDTGYETDAEVDKDVQERKAEETEEEKEKERKKLRLYKWLEEQSTEYRDMFFKMIQLDAIMEMFEALKNMKKTPGDVWKNVIAKLKNAAKLPVSSEEKKKFDFKKFVEILLPILGALAATLIAIKDAEGEEIEAAKKLNEKTEDEMTPEEKTEAKNKALIKEEQAEALKKSIVLSLAEAKQNGFSL